MQLSSASKDVLVGVSVGVIDIALFYPLAVLATRRENGFTLYDALVKQRKIYAGAATAGSLLIPYSVLVEAGTGQIRRYLQNRKEEKDEQNNALLKTITAVSAGMISAFVITCGLQPIEKMMVVSQLLQDSASKELSQQSQQNNPIKKMISYKQRYGMKALFYSGFWPLYMRECIYVTTITVLNPYMTSVVQKSSASYHQQLLMKLCGAFTLGFSAGLITAPLQTLNAMMKSETNRGKYKVNEIIDLKQGIPWIRLFYGSVVRSTRCGGAGMLYSGCRELYETLLAR